MNGETKSGVSTISVERLQCVRRDSAGPQNEEEEDLAVDGRIMDIDLLEPPRSSRHSIHEGGKVVSHMHRPPLHPPPPKESIPMALVRSKGESQ
jgi:hypothetical protein